LINDFKKAYGFLSNFAMVPVVFMGETWPSTEHAFQAFKSREKPIRDLIRELPEAKDAKKAGRRCTCRNDWDLIRRPLMEHLVRLKFMQHADLAQKLLDTENQILVEGNYWCDNEWGDCRCDKCKNIDGQNMLGQILTTVRQELKTLRIVCQ
jgi:ribA/ribD-fused uncharacterized protein